MVKRLTQRLEVKPQGLTTEQPMVQLDCPELKTER